MRHFILTLILILFAFSAFAGQVNLAWEPSPTADVTGYVLYYGTDPAALEFSRDMGNVLTAEVDGLAPGDWYFAVTAYNALDESDYSNVVSYTEAGFTPTETLHIPITKPATVNITITVE